MTDLCDCELRYTDRPNALFGRALRSRDIARCSKKYKNNIFVRIRVLIDDVSLARHGPAPPNPARIVFKSDK